MGKKARLGLYLENDEMKRQIKIAAAKRGISITAYCTQAIEERLKKDGDMGANIAKSKLEFLSRVDRLKKEIGPIKISVAELVKEGRRR